MKLLYIQDAERLMGFLNKDVFVPNPDEMTRKGESAESIEWAKQAVKENKTAKTIAALGAIRSNFVSLYFIAQPLEHSPIMDLCWEKKEVTMCLHNGHIFTFNTETFAVTGFDTQELEPGWLGPEYTSLVTLWQLADKERNRAADCLN